MLLSEFVLFNSRTVKQSACWVCFQILPSCITRIWLRGVYQEDHLEDHCSDPEARRGWALQDSGRGFVRACTSADGHSCGHALVWIYTRCGFVRICTGADGHSCGHACVRICTGCGFVRMCTSAEGHTCGYALVRVRTRGGFVRIRTRADKHGGHY